MIFVLHASADKARGEELAAALRPMSAFATSVGAGGVQFGAGSLCVILWSEAVTRSEAVAMLEAVSNAWSNTVICRFGEGSAPMTFGGAPVVDMRPEGSLASLKATLQAKIAECDTRRQGTSSPKLATTPAAAAKNATSSLALRSTYGLAATLAVVGVVAPSIIERAQATSPSDETPVPDLLAADALPAVEFTAEVAAEALPDSQYARLGRLLSASIEPIDLDVESASEDRSLAQFAFAEALHGGEQDYAIESGGFLSADLAAAKPGALAPSEGMFVLASDRGKAHAGPDARHADAGDRRNFAADSVGE